MTRKQVQELGKDDIASFRSALGRIKDILYLCKVGRAFQAEIFGLAKFPQRRFEELLYRTLSVLSLESLLELLEESRRGEEGRGSERPAASDKRPAASS